MKANIEKRTCKAMPVALAAIFALGLTACERQPDAPTRSGQSLDSVPEKAAGSNSPPGALDSTSGQTASARQASDAELAARVKAVIAAEPALQSLKFDINAIDGVVTLNGTAGTRAERERAARLALAVEGVQAVRNELLVIRES